MLGKDNRGGVPAIRRSTALIPHSNDDQPLFSQVLRNSLSGLISFAIVGIVLISIACAVAYANPDPDSLIMPMSLASLLPSMFAAGFVCTKKTGDAPLLCGIVTGGIITVFTILISLLLQGISVSGYEFWQQSLLHGIAILFCILGSFAGNAKRKVDPRKHRRFK